MSKFEIITAVDEKNRVCVAYLMVDMPGTSDPITVCKAVAKCHPDDTFDAKYGVRLAKAKVIAKWRHQEKRFMEERIKILHKELAKAESERVRLDKKIQEADAFFDKISI